jgi:hypothetical protein
VDEFVILDSVQFTKNDWRNRNRIATPAGPAWLTIPIRTAGRFSQAIKDAEVADAGWAHRHWRTLVQNYAKAPNFGRYAPELEAAYDCAAREPHLSRINRVFLDLLCRWLGIQTRITSSELYPDAPDRVERLIAICRAAGAATYLSGPKAKSYLDPARFAAAGIALRFVEYRESSEPRLSALDGVLRA